MCPCGQGLYRTRFASQSTGCIINVTSLRTSYYTARSGERKRRGRGSEQPVGRTLYAVPAAIQNMRVNHRRSYIPVSQ